MEFGWWIILIFEVWFQNQYNFNSVRFVGIVRIHNSNVHFPKRNKENNKNHSSISVFVHSSVRYFNCKRGFIFNAIVPLSQCESENVQFIIYSWNQEWNCHHVCLLVGGQVNWNDRMSFWIESKFSSTYCAQPEKKEEKKKHFFLFVPRQTMGNVVIVSNVRKF